jgi:hypothetical protein
MVLLSMPWMDGDAQHAMCCCFTPGAHANNISCLKFDGVQVWTYLIQAPPGAKPNPHVMVPPVFLLPKIPSFPPKVRMGQPQYPCEQQRGADDLAGVKGRSLRVGEPVRCEHWWSECPVRVNQPRALLHTQKWVKEN